MIRALCDASGNKPAAQLTDGLFGGTRRLHKRLVEYSLFQKPEMYRTLLGLPYHELVRCSNRLAASISSEHNVSLSPVDVLIDAPPLHREVEFKVDIYFPAEQTYRPLRDVSPIVASMSNTAFDDCVKRVRICVSDNVVQLQLKPEAIDELLQGAVDGCVSDDP